MKRYLLIITACLLMVFGMEAQSLRTCRYWYDRDIGNAITTSFNGNIGQLQLNVNALAGGLHTLHFQVADTSMNWSSTKSYLFMKPEDYGLDNLSYRCWFDYDIENQQSGSFGNGSLLMDVTNLNYGMHTLHLQLVSSTITSTKSYLFLKPEDSSPEDLSYRCWFDYDTGNQQTGSLETGSLLLDVSNLSDGIHTLHLQLEGSTMISTKSYMFMKVSTYSGELQYRCWFDEDDSTVLTGQVNSGVFLLDVTTLSIGQHDLNIQLFNGNLSSPRRYSFYRGPAVLVSANPVEGGTAAAQLVDSICTITATANEGYAFENWTENGSIVATEPSFSFIVTGDRALMANFEGNNISQTTQLSRGWNWYSTYIEQEGIDGLGQLENSIGVPKAIIQSQGDGYVKSILRNGRILWGGALSSINNEEMYKIGTKYICEATMEGVATNPAEHPITINKGWNWIGFPCDQNVNLNVAMSGFNPKNNDVIKGIHSYATFSNGTWSGTLNTLEPGQGYMYGSRSNAPKTLVYQTGRGEATKANITPENNFFQPVDDYADNMTLTAVVELDGTELRSDDYELAAFVGDECRGSVKLMYVESIDRYVAFLTVFGEQEEDLHFRLTDGVATSLSTDRLAYTTDGILGALDSPVVLRFGTTDVDENMTANVRIYPNPSEGIFNIEGQNIRKVEVFNAFGQLLYAKDTENGLMMIDLTNRAAGIYLIRVVTDNGIWNSQVMKR